MVIKGYLPPSTRSRKIRKPIVLAHETGILMIELMYAVVKYGNRGSSSIDLFTEVSIQTMCHVQLLQGPFLQKHFFNIHFTPWKFNIAPEKLWL